MRDPALPETEFVLAQRYREFGFPKEAAHRMVQVVSTVRDNPEYWYELGKDFGDADGEQSEAAYEQAVLLAPNDVGKLLDLAERQADNEHSAPAEQSYRRALALAPQSAGALSRLGGFLLEHPTPTSDQEAEGLLRHALELSPHNTYAQYRLGQLELKRDRAQQALCDFAQVLKANPRIGDVWYALSRAYSRVGDRRHAAMALARARALKQEFAERVDTEELVSLHRGNASLHCALARVCVKTGETARALLEYKQCVKLDPHNTTARNELDRFTASLKAAGRMPQIQVLNTLASDLAIARD